LGPENFENLSNHKKKKFGNCASWGFHKLRVTHNLQASHIDGGMKTIDFSTTLAKWPHLKSLPKNEIVIVINWCWLI
jgi:hypothetical protein